MDAFPTSFGDKLIELPEPIYQQMLAIVKEVAQSEPGIPSEIDGSISCFYCGNYQYDDGNSKVEIDGLPHERDCTYVKARALVAQKGR